MIRGWRIACFAAVLAASPAAWAQRNPEIAYIYPAGGQQGTTIEVALAGRYLDGVTGAVVSGGVEASLVEHVKPLSGKEINLLRDRLKELQALVDPKKNAQKNAADDDKPAVDTEIDRAAIEKEIAEIQRKLANPKNRNRDNPQLAEDLRLRIQLAADAVPGRRELRVRTAAGLSNPVVFHVGKLPEWNEKEPNEKLDTEVLPALPLVINGRIMPGDVDRFKLRLAKGMRLVVRAGAREMIPYLADGVPGWFQATLGLYGPDGREVAYADDYTFHPDPVILCEVPADGEYVLEIKDAIYRGREDFVYRITAGELPFVTSIFPLGGPAGEETTVELKGWNLPQDKLTITAKDDAGPTIPVSVGQAPAVSNTLPFAVGVLAEDREQEPNGQPADACKVTLPIIMNGRIDRPGDCDVFCFEGKAGQAVVAEVYARRLESPLDSILKLTDAQGRKLAANDDHEDKGAGLITHHADSYIAATLPSDGTYYLHLSDAQRNGGPDYGYRLRISPPRPDFELRVVPSTVNVRAGSSAAVTVHALRRDGFTGDITVVLKDAPKGFTLSGGEIAADKNEVKMSLKSPPGGMKEPVTLTFEGKATIDGRQVTRRALPADNKMQAFYYSHLVCAEDFKVTVIGRAAQAKKPAANANKPASKPAAQTAAAKPAAGAAMTQTAAKPMPQAAPAANIAPPQTAKKPVKKQ